MSKPGEVVSVHDVDVSDWLPERKEVHEWCMKHIHTGHRYHAYSDRTKEIDVLVCEDCSVSFVTFHPRLRGLIDFHIQEYVENDMQARRIWIGRIRRLWARFAPTASIASHILLGFVAVWFGLDAYFVGDYELASAWFFALVWALAGALEWEVYRGD